LALACHGNMTTKLLKRAGLGIVVVIFGFVAILAVRGQQSSSTSGALPVTTNWVGYLVIGQNDSFDRITSGPSPTTVRQIEIGLRSDGVVIWRESGKK